MFAGLLDGAMRVNFLGILLSCVPRHPFQSQVDIDVGSADTVGFEDLERAPMKVYLAEFKEEERTLLATEKDPWIQNLLAQVDESPSESPRPVQVEIKMRKLDQIYFVVGKVSTDLNLLCSRCGINFPFECAPSFTALFTQDPTMAGIQQAEDEVAHSSQRYGRARHAHDDQDSEGSESLNDDMDIVLLEKEFVDLSDILVEQLRLQIPTRPEPKVDAEGNCDFCGDEVSKSPVIHRDDAEIHPFAALKNLKNKWKQ